MEELDISVKMLSSFELVMLPLLKSVVGFLAAKRKFSLVGGDGTWIITVGEVA